MNVPKESYTYKDSITEFLVCLYVNFDFNGAQKKLRECETVSLSVCIYICITYIYIYIIFFVFCNNIRSLKGITNNDPS